MEVLYIKVLIDIDKRYIEDIRLEEVTMLALLNDNNVLDTSSGEVYEVDLNREEVMQSKFLTNFMVYSDLIMGGNSCVFYSGVADIKIFCNLSIGNPGDTIFNCDDNKLIVSDVISSLSHESYLKYILSFIPYLRSFGARVKYGESDFGTLIKPNEFLYLLLGNIYNNTRNVLKIVFRDSITTISLCDIPCSFIEYNNEIYFYDEDCVIGVEKWILERVKDFKKHLGRMNKYNLLDSSFSISPVLGVLELPSYADEFVIDNPDEIYRIQQESYFETLKIMCESVKILYNSLVVKNLVSYQSKSELDKLNKCINIKELETYTCLKSNLDIDFIKSAQKVNSFLLLEVADVEDNDLDSLVLNF